MEDFEKRLSDIRYRLDMEEESEDVILADLVKLEEEYKMGIFLYKAPNMNGYDVSCKPTYIKNKDFLTFVVTTIGIAQICKVTCSGKPGYIVNTHGDQTICQSPATIDALSRGDVLYLVLTCMSYGVTYLLRREEEVPGESDQILLVEKGVIYYGDVVYKRRALRAKPKRNQKTVIQQQYKGLPFYTADF